MTCSRMAESWRRSERVSAKKVENLVLRLLRSATALQSTHKQPHTALLLSTAVLLSAAGSGFSTDSAAQS